MLLVKVEPVENFPGQYTGSGNISAAAAIFQLVVPCAIGLIPSEACEECKMKLPAESGPVKWGPIHTPAQTDQRYRHSHSWYCDVLRHYCIQEYLQANAVADLCFNVRPERSSFIILVQDQT